LKRLTDVKTSRRSKLGQRGQAAKTKATPSQAKDGGRVEEVVGIAERGDHDRFVDAASGVGEERQLPAAPRPPSSMTSPIHARMKRAVPVGARIPGADHELLATYRFDEEGHRRLAAAVKSGALTPSASLYQGKIEPPKPGDVAQLPAAGSSEEEALRARGEAAIKNGEVAVVVLAGGMATRFQGAKGIVLQPGEQVVKGTVDVIDGKSFIALKLADARRAASAHGGEIPFCVMGSFGTLPGRNGLVRHLEDQGLMGDDVKIFSQSISVRVTPDGKIFGAGGGAPLPKESYTAPGHGDFFKAIRDSGVLDELRKSGVKTIMFSNVDNLGATVDPRIVGHFLKQREEQGTAMLAETVERRPEDGAKTGTVVYADGLFRILEGFRIPDDVAKDVPLPELSVNTFYFDADRLAQDIPLDVHAVKKSVDGQDVIQFETVTCEATGSLDASGKPLLPLSVLRLPREGAVGRFHEGRFYPVKTPEDLDRVRGLLKESPVYGAHDVKSGDAADRSQRLELLDATFAARFGGEERVQGPRRTFSSPGRINIIGEHVDYQDGLALPAAVHLGVLLVSQARTDDEVVLHSLDLEDPVRFSLSSPALEGDTTWGRYAKAVALAFQEKGIPLKGLQGVLESSLPPGSGMSSSSALCLALVTAFAAHAEVSFTNKELVLLSQRAEHIVGVNCGNMDQSAIVNGKQGQAVLLDCRTLDTRTVPLQLGDHVLVVGNTRKPRGLVDSEYNKRREECEDAVARLRALTGRELKNLRDVTTEDLAKHGAALPKKLLDRARHVVEETARVTRFAEVLAEGGDDRLARLGALLDESHRSLRDLFEVSCDELDTMVELARAYGDGAVAGARMMGGGFGGCTLSLVRRDAVEGFKRDVGEAYRKKTGLTPELWVVEPADGVGEIGRAAGTDRAKAPKSTAAPSSGVRAPHMTIQNPISAAECPDPTVLRVGNDFYIANTSPQPQTHQPGDAAYPLRKAVDGDFNNLVDIGHIFPKGKAPAWLHTDPWAPEFHHDEELGYTVTFTGRDKDGRLCIGMAFSDKPEGPYAERVPGPFLKNDQIGVIDSHVFFDEATGKRTFFWKEDWNDRPGEKKTTPILMQELVTTADGPKLTGPVRQTIENDLPFEGELVEGASVVKRGDYHYMFYSAGPYYNGDYLTSVARAKSLSGPWEKIGANVMPNDRHWEGRGHGYVAQDKHGNDYFVCHGYPAGDYKKRIMLMFPIHWENGWPRIDTKSTVVREGFDKQPAAATAP
jgi:galactokinase